jgi:hypothetical protein
MILNKDIHPRRKIYYLGAIVLDVIKQSPNKEIDFFDTFQQLNEREKVSMNLFILVMDWLFLLGAIDTNREKIKKCF